MNSSFESFTGGRSSALRTQQMEEIVKFESPGQNAVECERTLRHRAHA